MPFAVATTMRSVLLVCTGLSAYFPLMANTNETSALGLCQGNDDFRCDVTQCIKKNLLCNGVSECRNGRDEHVSLCGCTLGEFQCNATVCIDLFKRCDGRGDCQDDSDEQKCETHICLPSQIKCDNHLCIPRDFQCNFRDDCGDNSDEESCVYRKCYSSDWRCSNSQCIHSAYLCDGEVDCLDGSDEKDCDDHVRCANGLYVSREHRCDGWIDCVHSQEDELNCGVCNDTTHFHCLNGRCLRRSNYCDGVCDCEVTCDDEMDCGEIPCLAPGRYLCNNSHRCILPEYVCDGHNDCWDSLEGHDELLCITAASGEACLESLLCSDNKCVPATFQCDHVVDCTGGLDELDCEGSRPCLGRDMFQCDSGQCIQGDRLCDAVYDCMDMSDETHCADHVCPDDFRRCSVSGQCVRPEQWCDFHMDCLDWSDEQCDVPPSCGEREFQCRNGQCVPQEVVCIDANDDQGRVLGCVDHSHLIHCVDFECGPGLFKCQHSYCIDERKVCDTFPDCNATLTDELNCSQPCPSYEFVCWCHDDTMHCEDRELTALPDTSRERGLYRYLLSKNHLNDSLDADTFENLSHIIYLDISSNHIRNLTREIFRTLLRLSTLNVRDNDLTVLHSGTFIGLSSLTTLYLEENSIHTIESLAFHGLSSLTAINLSNQDLSVLEMNSFVGLKKLYRLDLSHNHIPFIKDGTFNGLPLMTLLDISSNEITLIESNVFNGLPSLQTLHTDLFPFCCLAPAVAECTPKPDEFSSCEDLMSNWVLRLCIWVLGLVALVGNTMVIYWRIRDKRDSKVHSFLITNLALGDLLMGVYMLIIACVDLQYRGVYMAFDLAWRHSGLCQFAGFISTYSCELSVFTLTVITIDRFVSIIFPFRKTRLNLCEAWVVMASLWVVVFILAALPLIDVPYFSNFYGRSGVCLALHITPEKPSGWEYSVSVFLALNCLSFLLIAVSYFWMFVVARRTRAAARSPQMKSDHAMARRMTLIVLTDFCCWVPIIALGVVSLCGVSVSRQVFAWIAVFVLPLNSAINPILYTLSTTSFLNPARQRVFKFRKSFMSSFSPTSDTRATNISHTDEKISPTGEEWAKPFRMLHPKGRGHDVIVLRGYEAVTQRDLTLKAHAECNNFIRGDSISGDCTGTDVICGYESDK